MLRKRDFLVALLFISSFSSSRLYLASTKRALGRAHSAKTEIIFNSIAHPRNRGRESASKRISVVGKRYWLCRFITFIMPSIIGFRSGERVRCNKYFYCGPANVLAKMEKQKVGREEISYCFHEWYLWVSANNERVPDRKPKWRRRKINNHSQYFPSPSLFFSGFESFSFSISHAHEKWIIFFNEYWCLSTVWKNREGNCDVFCETWKIVIWLLEGGKKIVVLGLSCRGEILHERRITHEVQNDSYVERPASKCKQFC